jgi:hypothetical protein
LLRLGLEKKKELIIGDWQMAICYFFLQADITG